MNRLRAKAGKGARALALIFATVAAWCCVFPAPARAQVRAADYWFAGSRLILERPQFRGNDLAIGSDDNGLGRFLSMTGATLSYQPGQNYAIVTSADRRTIAFTIGSAQYVAGGVTQTAPFAPYAVGRAVYLPFAALAKALYVDEVQDGSTTVLQPQLGSLDVRSVRSITILTLRGATPLRFKRLTAENDTHLALSFRGVASTLERERPLQQPSIGGLVIATAGSPKNPTTVVDFNALPGTVHVLAPTDSRNAIAVAFAPAGVQLGGTAIPSEGDSSVATVPLAVREPRVASAPPPAPPVPAPAYASPPLAAAPGRRPPPQNAPGLVAPEPDPGPVAAAGAGATAQITAVDASPADDSASIRVAISGDVNYEWHRLADNRWYVDLRPAVLAIPPQQNVLSNAAVEGVRVKGFVAPDGQQAVRVALSLTSPRIVTLASSAGALTLAVAATDDDVAQRAGTGALRGGRLLASVAPPVPAAAPAAANGGAPPDDAAQSEPAPASPAWKFGSSAGYNARLIVIDPGHGGSDFGAMHNGLTEKTLTLDISNRLRDLLVSRGWIVKLTRETDVDVYQPNDSARDELQARDDVANNAGARLFISVHINSFTSSALNGTTTYYYKNDSSGLAQAVHSRLAATLPTQDDGIRKENFYVIHHATMPAILVETAFLSNPSDADLLRDPAFLQKVAVGIADGVGDFASAPKPVSQAPADDGSP